MTQESKIGSAIAEWCGVKVGEKFRVKGQDNIEFSFDHLGTLKSPLGLGQNAIILQRLIQAGPSAIEKKPKIEHFKPVKGTTYYTIASNWFGYYFVKERIFTQSLEDLEKISLGNYYQSEEAAQKALEKYVLSMQDKYKLTIGKLIRNK